MLFCQKCGKQIAESFVHCPCCGSKQEPIPGFHSDKNVAPSVNSKRPSNNEVGKVCPYCQMPIKPGALVLKCPICGIPHHNECWRENGNKCTTYGCTGQGLNFREELTASTSETSGTKMFNYELTTPVDASVFGITAPVTGLIESMASVGQVVDKGKTVAVIAYQFPVGTSVSAAIIADKQGIVEKSFVRCGESVEKGQRILLFRPIMSAVPPDFGGMEYIEKSSVQETPNENSSIATNEKLVSNLKSGTQWFYWIAGLSLANLLAQSTGSSFSFMLGSFILDLVRVVWADSSHIPVMTLVTIIFCGLFVLTGYHGGKKENRWLYLAGMTVFIIDSLIFAGFILWFKIWDIFNGFAFILRFWAISSMFSGYKALGILIKNNRSAGR